MSPARAAGAAKPDAVIGPKAVKSPPQTEADGDLFTTFEWRDERWEVPASPDDWPLEAQEAFEDRRVVASVRFLVGDEQFRRLRRKATRVRDIADFLDVMSEALGFDDLGG